MTDRSPTLKEALVRMDSRSVRSFVHRHDHVGLLALLAVAGIVRIAVLNVDNIHNDEALWASYGLRAARTGDVLLLNVGVELQHIPVFFWAVGLSIVGLGNTELAVRTPNLAASLLTVWSVWTVARELAGLPAAWLAGLLFSLSPFAVLYGATVFLDPFALGLAMCAVALAFRGQPRLAGGLLALALGGKLFALAFVPLAAALAVLATPSIKWRRGRELLATFALASGLLLALMVIRTLVFDAPWFFSALLEGYDTGLASPGEWITRSGEWMAYAQLFFVSDVLWSTVGVGVVVALLSALHPRMEMRGRLGILAVATFIAGYAAFMVVVRSPIYDRYILYLIPPLCILAGVGLWWGLRVALPSTGARTVAMTVLVAVILIAARPGILKASGYGIAIGPRADATNEGYRTLCSWLRARETRSQIVWNHALSWPFAYCLQGSRILDYWFPSAADISPESPDMLVALSKADDPTTVSVLAARGWSVTLIRAFLGSGDQENFWVYRIQPPR